MRLQLACLLGVLCASRASAEPPVRPTLIGWAALPQETRRIGPTSGQFIGPANGITPPFAGTQPVPGWSGLLPERDGTFLVLPDNGFGTRANSADYVLGYYVIGARFKRSGDGTSKPGLLRITSFTAFRDPRGLLKNGAGVELEISADRATYYPGNTIAVDPAIKRDRLLTGHDFDVESVARARDGTLWVGDEFGPYLLHFAADGALLDEPIPHSTLRSPSHADVLAGKTSANLGASRGFEAMAFDARQRLLYAVPEAAPTGADDERMVQIFEVDPSKRAYTGRSFLYRKDGETKDNAIVTGDMANVGGEVYVLIERDSFYGANAVLKRLYLIDLRVRDANGVLEKRLLVDLLDVADPRDLGGDLPGLAPKQFSMPFDSIESVHPVDASTLAVGIDTNFPNEASRSAGKPDDAELILLRFPRPVRAYAPR